MKTKYPEVFAALAAPFEPHEVKVRTQAGRQLSYVTARTAMNRLDNVLGPENWWDEYVAAENSVLCKLTVRLPDGSTLTKQDAGGYAGMSDQGDDDKSGYSDAFKRACVKMGVSRYLYRDGVPHYPDGEAPAAVAVAAPPSNQNAIKPQTPAPTSRNGATGQYDNFKIPRAGKQVFAWAKAMEEHFRVSLITPMAEDGKAFGFGGNVTAWSQDQTDQVCENAINFLKSLDNYNGEFDNRSSQMDACETREARRPSAVEVARKAAADAVWQVVRAGGGGEPGRNSTEAFVRAAKDISANAPDKGGHVGQEIASIQAETDVAWLNNIATEALKLATVLGTGGAGGSAPDEDNPF